MLTRMVNGVQETVPADEEAVIRAEWAANANEPPVVLDPVVTQSQLQAALAAAGVAEDRVAAAMEAVAL